MGKPRYSFSKQHSSSSWGKPRHLQDSKDTQSLQFIVLPVGLAHKTSKERHYQFYFELLTLSPRSNLPTKEDYITLLHAGSLSLGHDPNLLTTSEGWNIDEPANQELCLFKYNFSPRLIESTSSGWDPGLWIHLPLGFTITQKRDNKDTWTPPPEPKTCHPFVFILFRFVYFRFYSPFNVCHSRCRRSPA